MYIKIVLTEKWEFTEKQFYHFVLLVRKVSEKSDIKFVYIIKRKKKMMLCLESCLLCIKMSQ